MDYRNRKKRRKSNKVIIPVIIIINVIVSIYILSIIRIPFLSDFSSKVIYTIDAALGAVSGVITEGTSYFGNTKKLNAKVSELENELEQTKISLQEINALKHENQDLKDLLNIKDKYNHFEKLYASVITHSYDNWNTTFVIDKGYNHGIKEKQTVIATHGLVGYISEVYENTSVVTAILDASSSVSVEISNINKLALVKGDYSLRNMGRLKLVNIPIDTEIAVGETVYSSGIGGLYKKGIPIGNVLKVVHKKNDIDRYAIVDVFVDIYSLKMVGIILN